MKSLRIVAAAITAVAALAGSGLAHESEAPGHPQNGLIGTWDLVITFGDGSKVQSTLTVVPGRTPGQGSVIHSAEASLLLPNPTTPEQGVWAHKEGRLFVASYRGFAVDERFTSPAGRIGFRHHIRVSRDQQSFVGVALFEVVGTDGSVLFSDTVQSVGTRQQPVEP